MDDTTSLVQAIQEASRRLAEAIEQVAVAIHYHADTSRHIDCDDVADAIRGVCDTIEATWGKR